MKKKQKVFKVGDVVKDTWFHLWGYGIVRKVLKKRIKIDFGCGDLKTYDEEHYQFLEVVDRK